MTKYVNRKLYLLNFNSHQFRKCLLNIWHSTHQEFIASSYHQEPIVPWNKSVLDKIYKSKNNERSYGLKG